MADKKKVVITYGTFDLFHRGHQALLERAKALGDYLIVGITSDGFDRARGKLNVKQPLYDRIKGVESCGAVNQIIIEEFKGQKIDDIHKYGVDIFAIGSDWEGRFDYLKDYCEVVYLPRTKGVSSTALRHGITREVNLCCIGENYMVDRLISETRYVSGIDVTAQCAVDETGTIVKAKDAGLLTTPTSMDEIAPLVDAVYVSTSAPFRYQIIKDALTHGLHVLYQGAIALKREQAQELSTLAKQNHLILMESLPVRWYPGFQRLRLLLQSGVIGEIKDIDASFSQVPDFLDMTNIYEGSLYTMLTRGLLPAYAFLGIEPASANLFCGFEDDFCTWAKCNLVYENATATCKVGRGVKTEGDMTITGTNGYIYIPAPWWRLEYFEIRGEDLRDTKKHFYELVGEGHRYMLNAFSEYCNAPERFTVVEDRLHDESIMLAGLLEDFESGKRTNLSNDAARFGGGETVVIKQEEVDTGII